MECSAAAAGSHPPVRPHLFELHNVGVTGEVAVVQDLALHILIHLQGQG